VIKPEILSDEQIVIILDKAHKPCPMEFKDEPKIRAVAQAQLDVAVAHYEPLIQQARQEVAREIFEEIESYLIMDNPYWLIPRERWQALKSKYTEGK